MKVVVFGSINVDLVCRVDVLPQRGQTVLASDFSKHIGGKGANQAVAAARCGAKTVLVGCVGQDDLGSDAVDAIARDGVDVSRVARVDRPTGTALVTVERSGENTIVVSGGANLLADPMSLDEILEPGDILLLQLEVPLEAVALATQIAKRAGVLVMLDPAPAALLPTELLSSVDWLTPNESEALVLTGLVDKAEAAKAIVSRGVRNVLLTASSRPLTFARPGEVLELPTFEVTAVDATAAGDAFNGAFAARLCAGDTELEAAKFACAAGALAATKKGAQSSLPMFEAVSELLRTR